MFNNNHEVYNRHFALLFNNLQYKLNKDDYFNKYIHSVKALESNFLQSSITLNEYNNFVDVIMNTTASYEFRLNSLKTIVGYILNYNNIMCMDYAKSNLSK